MKNYPFFIRSLVFALLLAPALALGQELKPIVLPAPQTDGGKPLMQALKDRHSTREFSPDKLTTQVLSNLLWAAFGINRVDAGMRTAPSTMNWQEVDIYVATADGLFLYDAKANELHQVAADDVRALTGKQAFVKDAPLNLVYVADLSKTGKGFDEEKNFCTGVDAGVIAQNVYLFCASEGLNVVVRAGFDRDPLGKAMKLRPDQRILLSQTVCYPKK